MKNKKLNILLFCFLTITVFGLSSCKDDNEDYSLVGTVWVHEYDTKDSDKDGIYAVALVFGKKNFDYYSLDINKHIIRLLNIYNYSIEKEQIVIGDSKSNLESNHIFCFGKYFYKSNKKPGDLCP